LTDIDLENKDLKKEVIAQMDAKAREYNFTSLEKIKKVHLTSTPFTVENDLITPTFKIKRGNAKKAYATQIEAMYAEPL
jgi:long-chain acyl-CoA synthetase